MRQMLWLSEKHLEIFRQATFEEISAAWYSKQEVKELLKDNHFAARTQAFCYMWARNK